MVGHKKTGEDHVVVRGKSFSEREGICPYIPLYLGAAFWTSSAHQWPEEDGGQNAYKAQPVDEQAEATAITLSKEPIFDWQGGSERIDEVIVGISQVQLL